MKVRMGLLSVLCLSLVSFSCQRWRNERIPYLPGEVPLLIVAPIEDTGEDESFELSAYEWRWMEGSFGKELHVRLSESDGERFHEFTSRHVRAKIGFLAEGEELSSAFIAEPLRTEFALSSGASGSNSPLVAVFPLPDGK